MTLHASSLGRGHRDDRRRRLLAEDLAASTAAEPVAAFSPQNRPPLHKSENYGDAEFLETQSRLTDLIPRRLVSYLRCLQEGYK